MARDKYFCVNVKKYDDSKNFEVYRPASLDNPKNNAVMFITEGFMGKADALRVVEGCLIFWPGSVNVPQEMKSKNAVAVVESPHNSYCRFFQENGITNLPEKHTYKMVDGVYIEDGSVIGEDCVIFPGAYIGCEVELGNNVYIGSGVKLLGNIRIGSNVVIRENTVIGADGLTTDRDENGKAITMPQFGGVVIEDDVQIGANTVIARGAIDDTVLSRGCKIDSSTFISHNVHIGEDSFIVGETILFGSSRIGSRVLLSGNSTLSNYVSVGDDTTVGQSSLVTKSIPSGKIAFGNPAKVVRDKSSISIKNA